MKRALLLLALAVAGCAEPTALIVFVDSDLPLTRVTVDVTGTDGVVATTATADDFGTADRPIRLTLVPDGTHRIEDGLEIEVKGFVGTDEVIDSTVLTRFTDGQVRFIPVYLWAVCQDVTCTEDEVCVANEMSVAGDCEAYTRNADRYEGSDPPPIGESTPITCSAECWHECSGRTPACEAPVELALGAAHSCARTREGHVFCWGEGAEGQLGHASTSGRPAIVDVLEGVTGLAAGDNHTCAVDGEGRAWCWGDGAEAQLGRGVEVGGSRTPVRPGGLSDSDVVTGVGAGGDGACLVVGRDDPEVRCFGANSHGSGGGAPGTIDAPSSVMDVNSALSIHVGVDHSCAVVQETNHQEAVCWGWSESGRLGNGILSDVDEITGQPVEAASAHLQDVRQLSVGDAASCAIVEPGGEIRCWGVNDDGQLGAGGGADGRATVGPGESGWTDVAMGLRQGCGIRSGEVWCWGWANGGALGVGATSPAAPTQVTQAANGTASRVALGGRRDPATPGEGFTHACALIDGAIYCWGDNDAGQLGLPDAGDRVTSPQPL